MYIKMFGIKSLEKYDNRGLTLDIMHQHHI